MNTPTAVWVYFVLMLVVMLHSNGKGRIKMTGFVSKSMEDTIKNEVL